MMGARLSFFSSFVGWVLVGCANDAPPPQSPAAKAPGAAAVCPNVVDAAFGAAVVARHAKAYGSAEAVEALLPISLVETASVGNATGTRETNITATASRMQAVVGALRTAYGTSADHVWTMHAGAGVVEPLTGSEGAEAAFRSWLLRRRFTLASELATAVVTCKPRFPDGARVDIRFNHEELGTPELAIDLESAALLAVAYRTADRRIAATTFEAWSEPDHGVRWPQRSTDHLSSGEETPFELSAQTRGLTCSRVEASGQVLPDQGEACVAPPPDRLVLRWPAPDAQGRVMARVPFTYLGGEILVRAKIDGRELNALLDSGAGTTAVDSTTRAGQSFRVLSQVGGNGASQKLRLGLGELAKIELGDLVVEHVPAASVPIPALESLGSQRPEVLLGYAFFAERVVRIDYANHQVIFAKKRDGLFAKGKDTRELPFQLLDGKIVAAGVVDGVEAPFSIDTGNGGSLALYRRWATPHGFPGARPVVSMKGRFGAGAEAATSTFFRIAKASVGPIAYDDQLATTTDPPEAGMIAGLAGNTVLARCDAVVFDMATRTITLEGPCDRPVPQRRVGWHFGNQSDPKAPERPFVVDALFPGGPADAAGVMVGDRLLDIGGIPASADVGTWWPLEEQPVGTKLPVTVSRAGAPVKLVIELRDLGH